MIKFALVLVSLVSCVIAENVPSIFLPPEADVVDIVGNGFKLQITQLNQIKDNWNQVASEASQISNPHEGQLGRVDSGMSKKVKDLGSVPRAYGPISDDLIQWVENRASQLTDKIDSLETELDTLKDNERVVVQILLLNSLVDLENLLSEKLSNTRWIRKKTKLMQKSKLALSSEVESWINGRIFENNALESKARGKNTPGDKWMVNVKALKRILHEQRFSEDVRSMIVNYLAGKFNMMERTIVFDLFKKDRKLDDILYYKKSRGHVPAHFPFSAQEATVNDV